MARVQIITTYDQGPYSACEALWLDLAEAAVAAGHEIEVLLGDSAKRHKRTSALAAKGARLRYRASIPKSKLLQLMRKVWDRTLAAFCLSRLIDSRPDIRILNVGTISEIALDPWARLLEESEAPIGVIVHNSPEIRTYSRKTEQRLSRLLQSVARAYFVSDRLKNNAEEQLLTRIPNVVTVRNPVNLDSYDMEPWPEDSQVNLRFAVVGRLDAHIKGQIRLLHALSHDRWSQRNWSLTFFGEGPDRLKIEKAVAFYGLEGRVSFGGFVRNIRTEIWRKHHVLVMPSMLEGMPLALVEAMICGRPAVCSDVGGASELIRDEYNGFIAGAPFAVQLELALERLWGAREELESIGLRAAEAAHDFLPNEPGGDLLSDILQAIDVG